MEKQQIYLKKGILCIQTKNLVIIYCLGQKVNFIGFYSHEFECGIKIFAFIFEITVVFYSKNEDYSLIKIT